MDLTSMTLHFNSLYKELYYSYTKEDAIAIAFDMIKQRYKEYNFDSIDVVMAQNFAGFEFIEKLPANHEWYETEEDFSEAY